jgi:beta-lactamase regulating signal transducer with metallopeptidase domain
MNAPAMNSPWMVAWMGTIERIGIALVHSLWQGALVGLLLLIGLVMLRRCRAQARYLACCLALVTTLLLPACTFFALPADRIASPTADDPVGPSFVTSAAAALEAAASLLPPELSGETAERIADKAEESEMSTSVAPQTPDRTGWLSAPAERLLWAMVAAWSVGVILLSCRVLGGYVVAWRLTRRLVVPLDDVWWARLRQLAPRRGIKKSIEIWQSAAVEVPAVVGCFRPVILLPIGMLTGLSVAHVESILAHELAHIRRHDFLVNAVQSLIETLLFYHPCVWWISSRIRDERELCCDETAVEVCGDALVYARALTGLEELRPPARLAMALSGGGPLLGRIGRIVGQPRASDVVGGWLTGSLAVVLPLFVGGMWAWDRVAWGRVDGTESEPAIHAVAAESGPVGSSASRKSAGRESIAPAGSDETPSRGSGPESTPSDSDSESRAPTSPAAGPLGGPPRVAFLAPPGPGFNGPPENLAARMVEEHGAQRVVEVVVSRVPAHAYNYVYDHLWRLLPNVGYFGTSSGDTVTVHLAPIDDLEAFASQIDLGEIRSVDREKRQISLVADPARLPRPQAPAVVDGPDADLETLCQHLVELDRTAVEGLVAYGAEAEPAVAPYVKHDERRVRRAALLVLKRVASDASLPVLLSALADVDLGNRDLAWQAICKLPGWSDRREVMEAAADALTREPEQAAKWLTMIGPSAEAFVWPSLDHDDPRVRLAAVDVLAQVGTAKSLSALESLGDDEVEAVARAAGRARQAISRR